MYTYMYTHTHMYTRVYTCMQLRMRKSHSIPSYPLHTSSCETVILQNIQFSTACAKLCYLEVYSIISFKNMSHIHDMCLKNHTI